MRYLRSIPQCNVQTYLRKDMFRVADAKRKDMFYTNRVTIS